MERNKSLFDIDKVKLGNGLYRSLIENLNQWYSIQKFDVVDLIFEEKSLNLTLKSKGSYIEFDFFVNRYLKIGINNMIFTYFTDDLNNHLLGILIDSLFEGRFSIEHYEDLKNGKILKYSIDWESNDILSLNQELRTTFHETDLLRCKRCVINGKTLFDCESMKNGLKG